MKTATIALEVWDKNEFEHQQNAFRKAIDSVLGGLIAADAADRISAQAVAALNGDASILNRIVLFEYAADDDDLPSRRVVHVEKVENGYLAGRDLTRLDGERAGFRTFLEDRIVGDILIIA